MNVKLSLKCAEIEVRKKILTKLPAVIFIYFLFIIYSFVLHEM